jgi:hypothetical protein
MCFYFVKTKNEEGQMDNNKKYQESLPPKRKPKFWRMMLRHTKNTRSLSLPRRKPKFKRIMLQHTKNTRSPSLPRRKC